MKGAIALAAIALLLAWVGITMIRANAGSPDRGHDLVGWALAFLSVILLVISAARAAHS
jgi:hypothetical protein